MIRLQTVFVVDDDPAVRGELKAMIEAAGLRVSTYDNAEDFLAVSGPHLHGCVLLEVRLPRMNGPELQSALSVRGVRLPIIFLTAYGDVATSVRALRAGAFDFLEKPIESEVLLERIRAALETDATSRAIEDEIQSRHEKLARLTSRERDVMDLVVRGYSNKNIAKHLGISHRTVEVYRSRVMQKVQVPTLLELVIFAEACGATVSHSAPRMDSGESLAVLKEPSAPRPVGLAAEPAAPAEPAAGSDTRSS